MQTPLSAPRGGAKLYRLGAGEAMKRRRPVAHWFKGLALGLALLLGAAACAEPGRASGPALWRLADEDSEIWLFGTVHMLPPDLDWRTDRIDAAFTGADWVMFETDTEGPAQDRLRALFLERGFDRTGPPLSAQLAPEDRARLQRAARRFGLNAAALEPMRPWFAAVQLSIAYVQAQGQAAESGVDTILNAEANRRGIPRRYFETAEQQIGFLADLPPDAERTFLTSTLNEIEADAGDIQALDAAWVSGDTQTLARLLSESMADAGPDVRRVLITERNARWAGEIETLLAGEGRIFIAVGAAHLIGDDSVIALLRARGHTIEGP